MTASAISLHDLGRRYGRLTALRDFTLEVRQGEIFGFLGLNGAGKTTTIRILLDLLRPDSGSAAVMGFDCRRQGDRAPEVRNLMALRGVPEYDHPQVNTVCFGGSCGG
jgi:ABC-2 type transport system ATP-binding protein